MISCPSCGAGLRFDVPSQMMVCDHCDSRYDPGTIDTGRGDSTQTGVNEFDAAVFICPSCGAELLSPVVRAGEPRRHTQGARRHPR